MLPGNTQQNSSFEFNQVNTATLDQSLVEVFFGLFTAACLHAAISSLKIHVKPSSRAGDFAAVDSEILNWDDVPTLGRLIEDHTEQEKAEKATLTVFKSVGIGLMDLALGTGVLRRMGLLGGPPFASDAARLK